jgi:hypothetical protein
MSGKWQRTFEVSVPVERVWQAFTRPRSAPPPQARPDPNAHVEPQILEMQPMKLLRWSAEGRRRRVIGAASVRGPRARNEI